MRKLELILVLLFLSVIFLFISCSIENNDTNNYPQKVVIGKYSEIDPYKLKIENFKRIKEGIYNVFISLTPNDTLKPYTTINLDIKNYKLNDVYKGVLDLEYSNPKGQLSTVYTSKYEFRMFKITTNKYRGFLTIDDKNIIAFDNISIK